MVEPACAAARNSSSSGSASAAPRSGANLSRGRRAGGQIAQYIANEREGRKGTCSVRHSLARHFWCEPSATRQCQILGGAMLCTGLTASRSAWPHRQSGATGRGPPPPPAARVGRSEARQIRLRQPTSCDSAALRSTCDTCRAGLIATAGQAGRPAPNSSQSNKAGLPGAGGGLPPARSRPQPAPREPPPGACCTTPAAGAHLQSQGGDKPEAQRCVAV